MLRILLFTTVFIFFGAISFSQITPQEAAVLMQKGINLGNTLEPPLEGQWGNPPVQEYYFDMYKAAGFSCIRIPVRWDMHTQDTFPYKIDPTWLQRIEQVVDWGLARGLFIVINAHHEEWIKSNYTNASYRARFDSIWSQISVRFKDKSDRLLFEIINEPYGLTKAQNDDLHQRELSIIRKTNPTRIVIFQGHNWGGSDELIQAAIPNDSFIMGSFHTYDPYPYGLLGTGTFGAADISALTSKFAAVKSWSVAHNIPVFLGEFGAVKTCEYNSRMKDYKTYVELAQANGFVFCAWDDGGDFRILERETHQWNELKDILVNSTSSSPKNPVLSLLNDTIIKVAWIKARSDYDSIYIERRTASTNYQRVAAMSGDSMKYLDLHLPQNKDYYYRIIAHFTSGTNLYSYPQKIFLPTYIPVNREAFLGSSVSIPGTVEAENFDLGGEGLAYHDGTPSNLGNAYRPGEGVDIYSVNGSSYQIGSIMAGEWLEYSLNVTEEADYNIDVYISSLQTGGTFKLKIGSVESDTLTAVSTGSYLNTKSVSSKMHLPAGEQIMRISIFSQPLFNIDKLEFNIATLTKNINGNEEKMIIYQNQNRDLCLNISRDLDIQSIMVYNSNGSLVKMLQNPDHELILSTSGMPPGLYIINALGSTFKYSGKVILN